MKSHTLSIAVCLLALAAAATSTAEAAKRKLTAQPAAPPPGWGNAAACQGAAQFHCGPLYNSNVYLGTDPDPFIRGQIQRDLGAKYGPSE
jgi:hypothetical protein